MLSHVIQTVMLAGHGSKLMVVSPERDRVPQWVPVLPDPGLGLNEAVALARHWCLERSPAPMMVLASDLPWITVDDIRDFVHQGRRSDLTIAPNETQDGTNALFLNTSARFTFHYGVHSCSKHEEEGRRLGLSVSRCTLTGLSSDVDSPLDLERYLSESARGCLRYDR